jgi:hypothetical protein
VGLVLRLLVWAEPRNVERHHHSVRGSGRGRHVKRAGHQSRPVGAWSPTGQRLAYIKPASAGSEYGGSIETVALDGGAPRRVISDPALFSVLSFSCLLWIRDGYYLDGNTVFHGFLRAADGTITTFDASGAGTGAYQGTLGADINAAGTVAGYYYNAQAVSRGLGLPEEKNGDSDPAALTFSSPNGKPGPSLPGLANPKKPELWRFRVSFWTPLTWLTARPKGADHQWREVPPM